MTVLNLQKIVIPLVISVAGILSTVLLGTIGIYCKYQPRHCTSHTHSFVQKISAVINGTCRRVQWYTPADLCIGISIQLEVD